MMQRAWVLPLLASAALLAGCAMCQDTTDYTGPVPESENFPAFDYSPRVNSAVGYNPAMGAPPPGAVAPETVAPAQVHEPQLAD